MTYKFTTLVDDFETLYTKNLVTPNDISQDLVDPSYSTADGTQLTSCYKLNESWYPDSTQDWKFNNSFPSLNLAVLARYGYLIEPGPNSDGVLNIALFNADRQTCSSYDAGELRDDHEDKRGWYLRRLLARIFVCYPSDIAGTWGPTLTNNSPDKTDQQLSVTSSSGWSATATAGEFNTAGVGASDSNTITSSFADFSLTNLSENGLNPVGSGSDTAKGGILKHLWQLNYDPTTGTSGPTEGIRIPATPNNAHSDFKLIDQGNWAIPSSNTGLLLTINVQVGVMLEHIEGTKYGPFGYNYVCDRVLFEWRSQKNVTLPVAPATAGTSAP